VAISNNNLSSNVASYSVFSSMGYRNQPANSRAEAANVQRQRDPNVNQANLLGQNMALGVDESSIKLKIGIPHIDAMLIDKTPQDPLNFKDMSSFKMNIQDGTLNLNAQELSAVVKKVASDQTNLLKDIRIDFAPGNRVNMDLKVKKFLNFNVKIEGNVTANSVNNMVRVTPDKISVNKIPVKGILDFFHLQIGEIVKIGKPTGSFFTSGDSIYFSPTKLVDNPAIDGNITGVQTGIGSISIMLGKDGTTPYKPQPLYGSDNYLRLRGGNVDFSGFNLKEADVTLLDQTPQDPFDMDNDPSKKVITAGQVSIPEAFIATALKNKAGEGSNLKDMRFTMPDGIGKLKANFWGFLPISLDLNFGNSSQGVLKVTPSKGKLLGFIPLPNSMLKDTLKKETEGQIDGDGVTVDLDKLADLRTSPLKKVSTSAGQLILNM
jgi:hypothetical protein